ncbi:hypothetical protein H5410_044035 [Solanum commersonii]|uniref:Uncharacterized protein n=1 Tax=Solanum commersonii TaxID=4109 RepID=A0A9J5XZ99_SOLCO|nr:hypothetical protein H5410_044035 [Solanum commersonii]
MEPIIPYGQNIPFSRSNDPRSSYGASGPSWPKRPILKVKRAPEQENPPFCRFSCTIVHGLFGDLEFRAYLCRNFLWTSIKTLDMEPVSPHGQNIPF